MKKTYLIILLLGFLILAGCAPAAVLEQPTATPPDPTSTPTATPPPSPTATVATPSPLTLEETAQEVINALADKDLETVANFVHPEQGIRFSPYTYVDESHLVFTPAELPGLVGSQEVFLWGAYDGTGDPIELTFDAYYDRFLYSADFANPEAMAVNEVLGSGNSLNNIADFYTGSSFVEYHFSGFDEDYGGMDWVSLRLVFIQEDGTWFLVGLVNDQWTI